MAKTSQMCLYPQPAHSGWKGTVRAGTASAVCIPTQTCLQSHTLDPLWRPWTHSSLEPQANRPSRLNTLSYFPTSPLAAWHTGPCGLVNHQTLLSPFELVTNLFLLTISTACALILPFLICVLEQPRNCCLGGKTFSILLHFDLGACKLNWQINKKKRKDLITY